MNPVVNRFAAARLLSIVGHPAVLMPVAVAGVVQSRGASASTAATALGLTGGLVLAVLVFSALRVRRGDWAHVDASRPKERVQLNLFLLALLLGAAALSQSLGAARPVVAGPLLAAALVGLALSLRRWLKLSLHTAFAVFAAALWWPDRLAGLGFLLLAGAVAWSRLALGRHSRAEVLVGALAGAVAGVAFQWLAPG